MRAEIVDEPLHAPDALKDLATPADGAVNLFLGVVRDHHDGRRVLRLEYQVYGPMARRKLREIAADVQARFSASSVVLLHRVGTLAIGEVSVVVAVATAHRKESFAACRHAIERIKAEVPIWKREHFEDGSAEWVPGCRPQDPPEPRGS
jgi:molybdopterin synthase catalytic subunit